MRMRTHAAWSLLSKVQHVAVEFDVLAVPRDILLQQAVLLFLLA